MAYPWYREGTITLSNGSAIVTGSMTGWGNPAYLRDGDALYRKDAGLLVLVDEIKTARGNPEALNTELELVSPWAGSTLEDIQYAIMPSALVRNKIATLSYDLLTFTQTVTVFISGIGPPSEEDGQNGWGYVDTENLKFHLKTDGEWNAGTSMVGPAGPAGPTYAATSTSSVAIGLGSKTWTVATGRPYLVGARLRATSAANPTTHYMEGVVSAYNAETGELSITVDKTGAGTGTRTDWNINSAGDVGAKGDTGASFAASSATELAIGTGTKAFTVAAGLAYVAGQRAKASSLANLGNTMEGVVASYVGATLTLTVDRVTGSGTFADWSIGLVGAVGATGRGYGGTSVTSRGLGTGSMSFTTQENLAWTAGSRVRAASAANPSTHYMEGLVESYAGNALAINFDRFVGSGSRADWTFSIVGDVGPKGDEGDEGDSGNDGAGYGGTSTTSLAIAVAQKTFTTQAGLAYAVGSRVRATSSADVANWMEGPCSSYGGTTLVIEVDLIGPTASGTHADWVFSIAGERGAPGSGNVDSVNGQTGPAVTLVASDIGNADAPTNYTPAAGNVAGHLQGIDTKLGAAGGGSPSVPQGRLTTVTATPVLASAQLAKTTIYYTPYIGRYVPLYDGSKFVMTDIGGELSQALSDATKSPAAAAANANYDLFVWDDAGTKRLSRGPAWSTNGAGSSTRGTGSGTTELERVQGLLVNKQAITNGPAAQRGTYVGTIRTNASSQVDFSLGGIAVGGSEGFVNVWNMYNRVSWAAFVGDSTDSWSYSTTTIRPANNSSTMRVSFVTGLDEGSVLAIYSAGFTTSGSGGRCGVGYDRTNAFDGTMFVPTSTVQFPGNLVRSPGLGFHFVSAVERGNSGCTFYGDAGSPASDQCGLLVQGQF